MNNRAHVMGVPLIAMSGEIDVTALRRGVIRVQDDVNYPFVWKLRIERHLVSRKFGWRRIDGPMSPVNDERLALVARRTGAAPHVELPNKGCVCNLSWARLIGRTDRDFGGVGFGGQGNGYERNAEGD